MLHARTRLNNSADMQVYSLAPTILEGQAVVHIVENNTGKATLSTGGAGEIFLGLASYQTLTPTNTVKVESIVAPAGGGTVTLQRTPIGGTTAVLVRKADGTVFTVQAGAPAAGQAQLVNDTLTFAAADGNSLFTVQYRYNLTVVEAEMLVGDGVPVSPAAVTGTIQVIKVGEVFTDQYDTSIDWSGNNLANIRAGINGTITVGGPGAVIPGAYVVSVPTPDVPYLGLYYTA